MMTECNRNTECYTIRLKKLANEGVYLLLSVSLLAWGDGYRHGHWYQPTVVDTNVVVSTSSREGGREGGIFLPGLSRIRILERRSHCAILSTCTKQALRAADSTVRRHIIHGLLLSGETHSLLLVSSFLTAKRKDHLSSLNTLYCFIILFHDVQANIFLAID